MSTTATRRASAPAHLVIARNIGTVLLAGFVGLVFWELWIRYGAPITTGKFPLQGPVGLAQAVLNKTFELNALVGRPTARQIAEIVHYGAAFVAFPLGYLLVANPVARAVNGVAPIAPFWLVGLAYGFGLFVFAGYVMGHLIAGFPPFFGWTQVAYGSMIGHMLLGLGISLAVWAVADR